MTARDWRGWDVPEHATLVGRRFPSLALLDSHRLSSANGGQWDAYCTCGWTSAVPGDLGTDRADAESLARAHALNHQAVKFTRW